MSRSVGKLIHRALQAGGPVNGGDDGLKRASGGGEGRTVGPGRGRTVKRPDADGRNSRPCVVLLPVGGVSTPSSRMKTRRVYRSDGFPCCDAVARGTNGSLPSVGRESSWVPRACRNAASTDQRVATAVADIAAIFMPRLHDDDISSVSVAFSTHGSTTRQISCFQDCLASLTDIFRQITRLLHIYFLQIFMGQL